MPSRGAREDSGYEKKSKPPGEGELWIRLGEELLQPIVAMAIHDHRAKRLGARWRTPGAEEVVDLGGGVGSRRRRGGKGGSVGGDGDGRGGRAGVRG